MSVPLGMSILDHLVRDGGIRGTVICMTGVLDDIRELQDGRVRAEAGASCAKVARFCARSGLGGAEFLAGIPGTLGGALAMNAGAFGQEIESVTLSVSGCLMDGTPFEIERSEIDFSYRRVPALENKVITSGRFGFNREKTPLLKERMQDILRLRAQKQPLDYPSCGSVFKRPPGSCSIRSSTAPPGAIPNRPSSPASSSRKRSESSGFPLKKPCS